MRFTWKVSYRYLSHVRSLNLEQLKFTLFSWSSALLILWHSISDHTHDESVYPNLLLRHFLRRWLPDSPLHFQEIFFHPPGIHIRSLLFTRSSLRTHIERARMPGQERFWHFGWFSWLIVLSSVCPFYVHLCLSVKNLLPLLSINVNMRSFCVFFDVFSFHNLSWFV